MDAVHASGVAKMARYTRDMLISDVLTSHDGVCEVFERHGLACAQCIGADMETLAAVAAMHEIDVDVLLADLNELAGTDGGSVTRS